jgi:hypothetical protein
MLFIYWKILDVGIRGKGELGSKTIWTVRGLAEKGGEGAEVILSVGGGGVLRSRGGAIFGGDDIGGESSGGFRGASGFEAIS